MVAGPRNHSSAIAGSNPESVELWNICRDLADWDSSKTVLYNKASQPSFFQPPTTLRRISAMNREFCGRRPDEVAEARLYELQFWKIPLISLRIERHKTISLRQGRSNDEISYNSRRFGP